MIIKNYFENPHTLHIGTLPPRAYYIPCADEETACSAQPRFASDRVIWLNGEWKAAYFASVRDIDTPLWEEDACRPSMSTVSIPSVWQTDGFDQNQYTNIQYPFPYDPPYVPYDNPCALYTRKFSLDSTCLEYLTHLNFEGVDSCYYLWINGKLVGYNQVSHCTGEFDITPFVREGENEISVLVLKWCDGSYLEDQDKFRMSGIFRDVYILLRPHCHIFDYTVKTILTRENKQAAVQVSLDNPLGDISFRYSLLDPSGKCIAEGQCERHELIIDVNSPVLWNAENPMLYTLLLKTEQEIIAERVGIRRITADGGVVRLNGSPILFNGVNRHDSDPFVGYAVGYEHVMRDLELMKLHNINAIRSSHYPNAPFVPQLCDQYGFYLIDEADLETHGVTSLYGSDAEFSKLANDPVYEEAWVDRVMLMYARDKNRPSAVMWSMGNEAGHGSNVEAALRYIKSVDITRLTHYEGAWATPKDYIPDLSNLDVHSRMYASIEEIRKYCEDSANTKPFVQCEYSHAMGNGPGDLEDYRQLMLQYDRFCGGFIWEWCDHGIYMGKAENGRDKFFYGGDSGEFPHDGNFCMDGLVYPDRRPHTGLLEYKNVIRPVRIQKNDDGGFILRNMTDFTVLGDAVTIEYELSRDGVVFDRDNLADSVFASLAARQATGFNLSLPQPGDCACMHIRFIYRQKYAASFVPAGYELGFDQLELFRAEQEPVLCAAAAPSASVKGDSIVITGEGFTYTYNCLTGIFSSIRAGEREMLTRPMSYNLWRAPTDNERVVKQQWYNCRFDRMVSRGYKTDVCEENGAAVITTELSLSAVSRQRFADIVSIWSVDGCGRISCRMEVRKNPAVPNFPRFGIRMFLSGAMENVDYVGYGPCESYVDKHRASWYGAFSATLDSLHEDYTRPQENGSHWSCDSVRVEGGGMKVSVKAAERSLCFNASAYTQEMLTQAAHNYELEKCGDTVLCVDYAQRGIGSASCGPVLLEQYELPASEFTFTFTMDFTAGEQ